MIGFFRQRFIIERPVIASDGMGGRSVTWEELPASPRMWGRLLPAGRTGGYAERAGDMRYRIRCPYRLDLYPGMRVTSGLRVFMIDSIVDPDGGHRVLEMGVIEQQDMEPQ